MSCEVCSYKPAEYTCRICGRKVCREDYVAESGICTVCEATLCEVCKRSLSIATCISCGRHCCEDCLVKVSQLEYICVECLKKTHGAMSR
ncbi:MAG: hypothetical protein LM556_00050 [Desulfurococcaceae archaeon]|nr:hypothetical protein [Desulfurococcaceae archaeon]